ncbi:hypothetical protein EDB85DRAFT_2211451 [Lactarius pseudohatsudake]|nr:hypothetical protein EDB85DRAFT_2211451 [Lactarius pseudohatsudake]
MAREDLETRDDTLSHKRIGTVHGRGFGHLHLQRALAKTESRLLCSPCTSLLYAISRDERPTATEDEGRDEAARLVLNYLIHHGCTKTAEASQAQLARIPTRAASPALPIPPPTSMSASVPADADSPVTLADHEIESGEPSMLEQRLSIVRSVRRGDIEGVLNELGEHFSDVPAQDSGMIRLKLRCRQSVELVNAAAKAKRALSSSATTPASHDGGEDADAMDVDDDAPTQAALKPALEYGRGLQTKYRADAAERPEVQALLERKWSVISRLMPGATSVGGLVRTPGMLSPGKSIRSS